MKRIACNSKLMLAMMYALQGPLGEKKKSTPRKNRVFLMSVRQGYDTSAMSVGLMETINLTQAATEYRDHICVL
jgi:hypothetical protein